MRAVGKKKNSGLVPVLVIVISFCYEINQHKHTSWLVYLLLNETIISTAYHYISLVYRWKKQKKKHGPVQNANTFGKK
jgi:hypothetical protein